MKTYHICVMYKDGINYYDGIFASDIKFKTAQDYSNIKNDIGKIMNPPRNGNDLIILSLTVIDE